MFKYEVRVLKKINYEFIELWKFKQEGITWLQYVPYSKASKLSKFCFINGTNTCRKPHFLTLTNITVTLQSFTTSPKQYPSNSTWFLRQLHLCSPTLLMVRVNHTNASWLTPVILLIKHEGINTDLHSEIKV